MRKFVFLICLILTGIFSKGQEIQTILLDRFQNPTSKARAVCKKVIEVHDSTLTIRLTYFKTKVELVEHYKNERPVGIWQEIRKKKVTIERNFDSIDYLPDTYFESIRAEATVTAKDSILEVYPSFPGGDEARIKFLQDCTEYPKVARENGYQGITFLEMTINEAGHIDSVAIIRSSNPYLDYEAVWVVKHMPKWAPGYQGGKPVKVRFRMPFKFTLAQSNTIPPIIILN